MPHCLIIGITDQGKTTLAKKFASEYRDAGVACIILDPMNDPGWRVNANESNCIHTTDPDVFLNVVWRSRKCAVFIDEAGEAVGRYDTVMHRTATKGRHWGHNMHYITQGGTQIAPIVRNQCTQLFIFATAKSAAKEHADEWNAPRLVEASTLQKGEYFHANRNGYCEKYRVF